MPSHASRIGPFRAGTTVATITLSERRPVSMRTLSLSEVKRKLTGLVDVVRNTDEEIVIVESAGA